MSAFLEWQNNDYYALLGVTRMDDEDHIRKAFRKRALADHPDRFQQPEQRAAAEARFLLLTEARDTLLDPSLREAYDREQDLLQQVYLDAMVSHYQTQIPIQTTPPKKKNFRETLFEVYENNQDPAASADFVVDEQGPRHFRDADDELEEEPAKGIPGHSKKRAAAYYYAQSLRYAALGQYRRAWYAISNAQNLDPELDIPAHVVNKIRIYAYYTRR